VYGPRSERKSSVVAKFIRHALNGEALPLFGDGTQTRDFIFIDDLVKAVLLAAATDAAAGEVFQIATARETNIYELAEILSEALVECGRSRPRIDIQAPRLGDVERNFSDTSKAKKLLGWQAEIGLREGLRETVKWAIEAQRQGSLVISTGTTLSSNRNDE
jgi:UDP-glucose 4-epimerase